MKKQERTFRWMTVCAALVLTAIVYAPMFKGKIPFPSDFVFDFPPFAPLIPSYDILPQTNIGDLVTSFYPYRTLAARAVREGSLPLWNPYMLSGGPFVGMTQSAVFYPGNFIYYVLPVYLAWALGFVIRPILATLFTAIFVRRLGGTTAASITAGLIFSFCGFLMGWQGQAITDAAIWLPLICYSVIRLHAEPTRRSIVIATVAFAMPVLAGHPETAAHLTLTGLALAVFMFVREPKIAFLTSFTAAGFLAIGLAAAQILPTLEWLTLIHNGVKAPWAPPPRVSLLGLVARDIAHAKTAIGLLMPEHAAYIAMMAFVAAPMAFLRKGSRGIALFFFVLTAAAISIAYGIGPAHWLIQQVPGLKMLKNARFTLIASFGIAVLAGLGLSAVEEFEQKSSRTRLLYAGFLGSIGLAIGGVLIYRVHAIPVASILEFVRLPRFTLMLLWASAFLILLTVIGKLSRRTFAVLAVLLAGVDLATVSYGAIPFTKPRDVFPKIPLFEQLPETSVEPYRIAQLGFAYGANFESIYGQRAVCGYEIPLERFKTFLSDISREEHDSVMLTTRGVLEAADRRVDMLNAKYYIVSEWDARYMEFRQQPDRFKFLYTFGDTDVYENLRAFPPAFLVPASGVEPIPDENRQLERVKSPSFDPTRSVVLPETPGPLAGDGSSRNAVEWTASGTNAFELNVSASEASVLVVSQTDYPGWKAYIDGRAAPITRANYLFPSIFISPGSHHVRFSFEPSSVRIGIALSILAVAVLGVMTFRGSNQSNPSRI